ncbi:uncharacterized protein Z518_05902 [Rhinocladiella mackenziei CBS 650.93]|uniref:AB hydrolase-1 domain-containing protein n=1 Tax=Rhinocladiella mackenziei CBS 650.93 TaxID=1442369 RepID=A0A0D2J7M3_9EURO|nr:uncharacterized protein Z518_05902 [Rhinocladiella mackenziei CBS 650.93]KIX05030.1 hypothetical protein Z518_05902 [Rhinocladiella mackenziei CBS 650.93]
MTMEISRHDFSNGDKTISYLESGPPEGPLLIFIHGWPAIADTWKHQIVTFSGLGFRVVAPDMPGYGGSTKTQEKRDYSMQSVVGGLISLLKHLNRGEAIWIGHDWGAAVVWALLAHHPEACIGVVNLAIPYRTLEMGLKEMLKYANRDLYPEDQYPNAQWDYQAFYQDEKNFEKAIKSFEADIDNLMKILYRKGNPETRNDVTPLARVSQNGGWFGGAEKPPEVPLSASLLDEDLHKKLVDAFTQGGFWAPTAMYLNHDVNYEWAEDWSVNEGVVSVPTLFIEALNDSVAGTYNSRTAEPMRNFCRKHMEVSIDAGHWVAQEAPQQTNAAIARWIATNLPSAWPWDKEIPLKPNV